MCRYIGTYFFQRPVLVPKSPELIKEICVTNSNNVLNRQGFTNDCSEPLMAKNLFGLNGKKNPYCIFHFTFRIY